jgi:hypothetical protein
VALAPTLAITKIALLARALIVPTLAILYNSSKKVKLNAIDLFKIVLKKDIIKLDIKDFFSNNKQYRIAIEEYKRDLLNRNIAKYILIILFSLLILILRLLILIISWIILLIYISLKTYKSKSISSSIKTL